MRPTVQSKAEKNGFCGRVGQVGLESRREQGGTGLGLSIVKHIGPLHGGRVWAESTLGVGTTFFFHVPLYREEPAEKYEDAEIKASPGGRNRL